MENIGIRVWETDKQILTNILSADDNYLHLLNWKLLFMVGTYNDDKMLPFEELVNSSEFGITVSYQEVKNLSNRVNDLWDLLLLGQLKKNKPVKKGDDEEIVFDSSDVVIECFDSSYWTITGSNINFIEGVKHRIGYMFEVYQ